MTAGKIVTNHLIELPIGMAADKESGPGATCDKPTSAETTAESGSGTKPDEQMEMALFNGH